MKRLHCERFAFVIAGLAVLLFPKPAGAATEPIVTSTELQKTFGAMSIEDRMKLPPTTVLKLPNGRSATIGTLLSEHVKRLGRLGKPPLRALSFSKRTSIDRTATSMSATSSVANSYTPPTFSLLYDASKYTNNPYAADYNAFCSNAKATVCLYFPSDASLSQSADVNDALADIDLFMTAAQCKYYNGEMGEYCALTYPDADSATFFSGIPPLTAQFQIDCPAPNFLSQPDPHGTLFISFPAAANLENYRTIDETAAMTCVGQVFAAPGSH